jgi:hypothetical protein
MGNPLIAFVERKSPALTLCKDTNSNFRFDDLLSQPDQSQNGFKP